MDYVRERSRTGLKSTFTESQDLKILRLRKDGVTFTKIADALNRSEGSVKSRYLVITGRKTPETRRNRAKAIAEPNERVDDAGHVAALRALGGFRSRDLDEVREQLWGRSRG